MSTLLHPGFADPVRDSQAIFRAVLDAMARPGRIHEVAAPAAPPPPLDRATAAALLTLVDADTRLFLDAGFFGAGFLDGGGGSVGEWVAFHCGAPLAEAGAARFAVALGPIGLGTLSAGTDEAPESSATLILQVAALGDGTRYRLDGPGLGEPSSICVGGLPGGFVDEWSANRRLFPRGVDVILCAGDRLAALPRTVRMEVG